MHRSGRVEFARRENEKVTGRWVHGMEKAGYVSEGGEVRKLKVEELM